MMFACRPWLPATVAAMLCLLPVSPVQAAVVLQYHHVADDTPASTSTTPERFAMHLDYLASHGFSVVPLQSLVDTLRAGAPLPDRTAAITFDDGYISIYETAWPLLRAKGWPFTVFINTEPHDRTRPLFMTWDQLRELQAGGATIANHSVSHPNLLDRQPGQDEAAWKNWVSGEIGGAERRIREELGEAPKLFAYPFGEYDEAVLEMTASLGYVGFGQQSGPLGAHSDLRVLPRFPFGGPYGDAQDFATKVNSLPMPLVVQEPFRFQAADGQTLGDIVLEGGAPPPVLALRFRDGFDPAGLNCFVSGQGRAQLVVDRPWVHVQATGPLAPGRSRYNCTAPSGQPGRFYWHSQLWIVR